MAQLWGGRFTGKTDDLVFAANASILFDIRLLPDDIRGSLAHARMLTSCGILTEEEGEKIREGLEAILRDVESQALSVDDSMEDVHSFVETELIKRIGEVGKKLHTGRSRNDQVATDMKLFTRRHIDLLDKELYALLQQIESIIEAHLRTWMPGFTHLQKAQPVTVSHHFAAYFEMFKRDRDRLKDIRVRMNTCPLGAGALAGTTYPLDRAQTAADLEFDAPAANSMDAVSDRDYLVELMAALSLIQMHMSRSCEELILWNSDDYRYIEIDDAYSTGSSIMPQKKNPDIAELIRGKTGRVYGSLVQMLTVLKGLPLAYNKDLQEDKESFFDAIDTVILCVKLYTGMLKSIRFREDELLRALAGGFLNATDAADYLVNKGVAFRDAHGIVGRMVLACLEKDCPLEELTLEELRAFSPAFEEDIYEALSAETCVQRRNTLGAPGSDAMKETIKNNRTYLEETTC